MPNAKAHAQNIIQAMHSPVWKRSLTAAAVWSMGFLALSELSAADVLILKGGGRLQGQFLVTPADNDLVYRFRSSDGIELTISKSGSFRCFDKYRWYS